VIDGAIGMAQGGWLWMGIWVLALLAIVWLLARDTGQATGDEPMGILRERFARGEISEAEYLQARRLLETTRGEAR
jgi:uncharacterized membrane protein